MINQEVSPPPHSWPWAMTLVVLVLAFSACQTCPASALDTATLTPSRILPLADFGAVPDSGLDAVPSLQSALAAAARYHGRPLVLRFAKGRYDFFPANATRRVLYISNTASERENPDPTKTVGLFLDGIRNLTLDGQGATLVFHGKMTPFVLERCEGVRLQNLHVDFERPTMSELRVVTAGPDWLEVEPHRDSKYAIEGGRLVWVGEGWRVTHGCIAQEYDPRSDQTWRSWCPVCTARNVEQIAPGRLRLHFSRTVDVPVGRVFQVREPTRDQVGAFVHRCRDISWSEVSLHYLHGLGVVCQFSQNLTFDRLDCEPRTESGRTCAGFADFLHFSGCRGRVRILDSRFVGSQDDPINVHGTHLRVTSQPGGNQIVVRFMHGQSYGFDAFVPGDVVEFIHNATLKPFGTRRVETVARLSDREILLTLSEPAPAGIGPEDCVENTTWTPSVEIRGCYFSRVPTRGILVTTRRPVLIAANRFHGLRMSPILIADDASSWFESGYVRNVAIRGNQFLNCADPQVLIQPENRMVSAGDFVHQNIRIEHNTFQTPGIPNLLQAKSTDHLRFSHNRIVLQKPVSLDQMVHFTACRDVVVTGNCVESTP